MAYPNSGCHVVCAPVGGVQRNGGHVSLLTAPFAWSQALATGGVSPETPRYSGRGDPVLIVTPFQDGWIAFSTNPAIAPNAAVEPRYPLAVADGKTSFVVEPGTRVAWVGA